LLLHGRAQALGKNDAGRDTAQGFHQAHRTYPPLPGMADKAIPVRPRTDMRAEWFRRAPGTVPP
jgi:hypothetical protein